MAVPWGKLSTLLFSIFGLLCFLDLAVHRRLALEYIPTWRRFLLFETLVGIACMVLLVHCGLGQANQAPAQRSLLIRLLTHRWLTLIGMISYSHYLIHFPVLMTIRWLTLNMKLPAPYVIFTMYLIATPISLLAGYLFFLLVESKCLPSHLRKGANERSTVASSPRIHS